MIVRSWGFVLGSSVVYGLFGGYVGGVCLFSGFGGGAFS